MSATIARYLASCDITQASTPAPKKEQTSGPYFWLVEAECYEEESDYDEDDDYGESYREPIIETVAVASTTQDQQGAEEAADWFLLETFSEVNIISSRRVTSLRDWDIEVDRSRYGYRGEIIK